MAPCAGRRPDTTGLLRNAANLRWASLRCDRPGLFRSRHGRGEGHEQPDNAYRSGAGVEPYDRIRWDIVHGILRPNEALIESELAERIGVSRTPIREALLRLEAQGLIVSRRRRWYVYEHTADEIMEIYEVRACRRRGRCRRRYSRASSGRQRHVP